MHISSIKTAIGLAGIIGIGVTLSAPAVAEVNATPTNSDSSIASLSSPIDSSSQGEFLIALTDREQAILEAYKPPKTDTFDPIYRIVDFDRVRPFLCTNNPGPVCGNEIGSIEDDSSFPIPRYGVTDEMRRPSSFYCRNSPNPLCENPENYGLAYTPTEDFRERTRALWAEFDQARERTTPVVPPPQREQTFTAPPRSNPAPAPIPGLW